MRVYIFIYIYIYRRYRCTVMLITTLVEESFGAQVVESPYFVTYLHCASVYYFIIIITRAECSSHTGPLKIITCVHYNIVVLQRIGVQKPFVRKSPAPLQQRSRQVARGGSDQFFVFRPRRVYLQLAIIRARRPGPFVIRSPFTNHGSARSDRYRRCACSVRG